MAGNVQFTNLPKILKKIDQVATIAESRDTVAAVGGLARSNLVDRMPASWQRPRQVTLQNTTNSARLSMPRYPYIFFERGSQRHSGAGPRTHQRKTAKQFKANGNYFIKPRRFIALTRIFIRKELVRQITDIKAKLNQAWAA